MKWFDNLVLYDNDVKLNCSPAPFLLSCISNMLSLRCRLSLS